MLLKVHQKSLSLPRISIILDNPENPVLYLHFKKQETVERTLAQYDQVAGVCRAIFLKKTKDYGTAWRILRPSSLTDQLYIKAKRIRTIQESGQQMVEDPVASEFQGIVNYSILALIQLSLPYDAPLELGETEASTLYDARLAEVRALMARKNSDYGEAWREMRQSSLVDLILMKLLRIKQIEDNQGLTLVSEGVGANYSDIINYALFALIQMEESAGAGHSESSNP
jgi:hypothetical protein